MQTEGPNILLFRLQNQKETLSHNIAFIFILEADVLHNESSKTNLTFKAHSDAGFIVSHTKYPDDLPSAKINSSLILAGLSIGSGITIKFVTLSLLTSASAPSENCSQYLRLQGVKRTGNSGTSIFCSSRDVENNDGTVNFEAISSNVTITFISTTKTPQMNKNTNGFLIQYEITKKPSKFVIE